MSIDFIVHRLHRLEQLMEQAAIISDSYTYDQCYIEYCALLKEKALKEAS